MRLTTKGRYAVTAMLDLAIHARQGPVSLNDISGRQGISLSLLSSPYEHLFFWPKLFSPIAHQYHL